jgi:hypothetical protein
MAGVVLSTFSPGHLPVAALLASGVALWLGAIGVCSSDRREADLCIEAGGLALGFLAFALIEGADEVAVISIAHRARCSRAGSGGSDFGVRTMHIATERDQG